MAERIVQHDGVGLCTRLDGEGAPVVLLHGLTATQRYVVMGSSALQRSGHLMVSYDARGHGASSPAPSADGYDYASLAADLLAVLDTLGLARVTLAGASMGAHTAVRFALDHPDRVAALCAITPAFAPGAAIDLDRWDALAVGLRDGGIDGFVAAYPWDELPGDWRATVENVVRQRLAQHTSLDAVADALACTPRSAPFGAWDELAALTVPALVVGSRDDADPSHRLAVAQQWTDALPDAELLVEEPGRSPLAWQGGQLSRAIATLVERAA